MTVTDETTPSCPQAWHGGLEAGLLVECDHRARHRGLHRNKKGDLSWGGYLTDAEHDLANELRAVRDALLADDACAVARRQLLGSMVDDKVSPAAAAARAAFRLGWDAALEHAAKGDAPTEPAPELELAGDAPTLVATD